ncbi:cobalt-precorrin 5A hydrolase [Methanobrevibacter sp. OttesenSCG-928-I08]|nr:cobalt-precorrin 5A hydrolase [Methanobrevibacter sp. OttesenSCG-928-I08]
MKIAIISLTEKGLKLSKKIKRNLDKDSTIIKTNIYYKSVKQNMNKAFIEYDAIITIMATGIVIRSISKLIKSKTKDPAIINIDENGNFVISLLSGHIGGANELSKKLSILLDAENVITTATDVNQKIAIDYLAYKFYLNILNPENIVFFNKAILEGRKITLNINKNSNFKYLEDYIKNNTLEMHLQKCENPEILNGEIVAEINNHKLFLKEKELVVGIGCRKGKTENEILFGINKALNDLNLDISRVNYLSTGDMKKNEEGIINLSENLKIPLKIISKDKLQLFTSNDCTKSDFVYKNFGVYGVCESSAMISAGFDSKLIYKKTPFNGVTIAIAISK